MPRPRIQGSIHINLAPEDVFDFALTDLHSMPDWMSSVDSIDSADASWPRVGSSHTYSRKAAEQIYSGKTTVMEADRPRRVVLREQTFHPGEDGAEPTIEDPERYGRTTWTFDPEDSGTRMTYVIEGANLKSVVWLVFRLLVQPRVQRNLLKSLANLKRICEEELEDVSERSEGSAGESTSG